jgi:hypothetical protein
MEQSQHSILCALPQFRFGLGLDVIKQSRGILVFLRHEEAGVIFGVHTTYRGFVMQGARPFEGQGGFATQGRLKMVGPGLTTIPSQAKASMAALNGHAWA